MTILLFKKNEYIKIKVILKRKMQKKKTANLKSNGRGSRRTSAPVKWGKRSWRLRWTRNCQRRKKVERLTSCANVSPFNIKSLSKALQTKPSTAGTICSGVNSSPTIPRWRANAKATIDVAKLSWLSVLIRFWVEFEVLYKSWKRQKQTINC